MNIPGWLGGLVSQLAPLLLSALGIPTEVVPLVTHAISTAETIPGATGPEKKAAALSIINDGILVLNDVAKRTVVDPVKIVPVIASAIDTVILILNMVKG